MTWAPASNANHQGLSDTDFRAMLRSSESRDTSGHAPITETQRRFAGALELTRIEVMSAALAGMRRSDPRRNRLCKAICSARDAIFERGRQ